MSEKSKRISRLLSDQNSRFSYIRAKLGILVPSQIRALRLKSDMSRQMDLAKAVGMGQSRISMIENPGVANVTLDTLARIAAVFKVGLMVKFVRFSEMLHWENEFSQDQFNVVRLEEDREFLVDSSANSQPVQALGWTIPHTLVSGSENSPYAARYAARTPDVEVNWRGYVRSGVQRAISERERSALPNYLTAVSQYGQQPSVSSLPKVLTA
ncbi:MAG: helix-turn-helix domain-containing protein [Nitrospiraceae bacterium]